MREKEYILFDLDGTLIDPIEGITGSVAYALEKLGVPVNDSNSLTRFIGPPLEWAFTEYCGFDGEKSVRAAGFYRENFSAKGVNQNKLYNGVIPMLKTLSREKKLVIATSKLELFAEQIADNLGFKQYFHAICGSGPPGKRTDKAEVIAYALDRCGISSPDEAIMVGDRMHDVIGAKKNNMKSVGVLYGYGNRKELADAGADYIAETVDALAALLLS